MEFEIKQSTEGLTSSEKIRQEVINKYLDNPKICKCCGKGIKIPLGKKVSQIKRKSFCDRSCAATYNNKGLKRHGKDHVCNDCGKSVSFGSKRCKICFSKLQSSLFPNRTLGEVRSKGNSKVAFSQIRLNARKILSEIGEQKCEYCGFDHFADACHIRPIKDFKDDDLMSTINDPSNLIWLCPNHHRMLDRGLLKIEEIRKEYKHE